ncbi:FGGY family carbohydrate kinase [Microtetraspora malaysiensis]|uniref:FGGY family carbohydrate kinase n=1 Tax=Microtetraspora malaysiensis TaxID=161358 RepID=UPI000830347B|nr:glycerol kinase GlpK [Microtetraspora malaysiensis]
MSRGALVGAIDQGTTSTRFLVYDERGTVVAHAQAEHGQRHPRPGWTEQDPEEILLRTRAVIDQALREARLAVTDLAAVGLTNQRETTLAWDRASGKALSPAVVWHDTRTAELVARAHATGREAEVVHRTGLPFATYFSAVKMRWLIDEVDGLRAAAESGSAALGTIDSWLLRHLLDAPVHLTDPTNASRTQLAGLETSAWDPELLELFGVPAAALAEITIDPGAAAGPGGLPIRAVLGDQHAALLGHGCVRPGEAKNTYGTGSFLLMNTGERPGSATGLLGTLGYDLGRHGRTYAIEGAVPVAGSLIRWLRDSLGVIGDLEEASTLADTVASTEGVYLVPAFSGLFSPHWRADARGVLVGLTAAIGRAHVARAALEAIAHQTADVLDAMDVEPAALRVDGGVTRSAVCMQAQADVLGLPVSRAASRESTALGAAFAAGLAAGVWGSTEEVRGLVGTDDEWEPRWSADRRESERRAWKDALSRSFGLA